jgi:hypothetical protein
VDVLTYIALADVAVTGSMGAPSAYRGEILQVTTFLVSPRKVLHLCL